MTTELYDSIGFLFERVVLSDHVSTTAARFPPDTSFAVNHALKMLHANVDSMDDELNALRLRVALHYSPVEALRYDKRNHRPLHRIIEEHLCTAFGKDGERAERLARDIAAVLRDSETTRSRVTGAAEDLLNRQQRRCAHCLVLLGPPARTAVRNDPYKPYHLDPEEWLQVEVDHVRPVSRTGTNRIENLQALCRLCNQGKGDGFAVDLRDEVRFAGKPIEEIDAAHRRRMFFAVVARDKGLGRIETDEQELTIRPITSTGCFVRSNLQAVPVSAC